MARTIQVRSRADLEKLAAELEKQFTIVFSDDYHFLAMKDGRIVKRFRAAPGRATPGRHVVGNPGELPSRGHLFLMYDELDRGTKLEARFLMDGLLNGERCVYATHQRVEEAERNLSRNGLPIEEFKAKGLVKVLKLEDPFLDAGGWSPAVGRIIEEIMEYGPDRIVSWRWIRDLTDPQQITVNKKVERLVRAAVKGESADPNFGRMRNFSGLFVCSYLLGESMPEPPAFGWLANHVASHDATIFVRKEENVLLSNQSR